MPPPESQPVADRRREGAAHALGRGGRRLSRRTGRWRRSSAAAPPAPRDGSGPANPIDAFVRARLDQEGLAPAPRASPETLIRRLAFDLTGLPPTLAEIDAFLADRRQAPTSGSSIATSPRRRTASAWRWTGSTWRATPTPTATRTTSSATCRRIATGSSARSTATFPTTSSSPGSSPAICCRTPTREQRIATAFNRLHRQTNEGGSIEEEFRTEYVVDRVNTFGTAMLGLTLECARCHDHKFDPITQRDYYSLFAFFNNIDESGLYSHFTNATPSPSLLLWPPAQEQEHQRLTAEMRAIEARACEHARAPARTAFDGAADADAIEPPAPIAHLAFDRVDGDKTPDAVLRSRRRVAGRRRARIPAGQPATLRGSAATTRSCTRARRRSRAPIRSRSRCGCSRPSCRTAPSSCISRAPGPTPAAAATS